MKESLQRRAIVATLAAAFAAGSSAATAQTADTRAPSLAELKQENAALRKKIERLELETENAKLRERLYRLEGEKASASAPITATNRPDRVSPTALPLGPRAASAMAADFPVKAPLYRGPLASADWTGLYLGANLGVGVGRNASSATSTGLSPDFANFFVNSSAIAPLGLIGGGQLGYTWQLDPHWVWGLEADIQGTDQSDSACGLICNAGGVSEPVTLEQKLRWFGTVRGRIGYAEDGWLWYVTGGFAYGQIDNDYSIVIPAGRGTSGGVNATHTQIGWTVGAGVETQLWGRWSAKAEYLYMNLGDTTDTFGWVNGNTPGTFTISSAVRNQVARVGLNYRWGAPAPQRMEDLHVATADWSGLYVGANVGSSLARNSTDSVLNQTAPPPPVTALLDTESLSPAGALGGAQIGYNWQPYARWVLGVEADAQWTDQESAICTFLCDAGALNLDQRLDWFGTVRGRLGYARDGWLWYATGGLAFGQVDNRYSFAEPPTVVLASTDAKHSQIGWTVGAGAETKLWDNWSAKIEYLYMDLGTTSDSFALSNVPGIGTDRFDIESRLHDHVFRVGVNYRFGPAPGLAGY